MVRKVMATKAMVRMATARKAIERKAMLRVRKALARKAVPRQTPAPRVQRPFASPAPQGLTATSGGSERRRERPWAEPLWPRGRRRKRK